VGHVGLRISLGADGAPVIGASQPRCLLLVSVLG
jgi:hypothetical protein